ncbi:type IV pilus twitching motility protein PilT [Oceanospirillum sediminis]|uniref:Type IV pilus twitching motility protein PilT n=1 Tax=Oceanospirillum sediminis TaxID=2760088 RepID=A0A839IPQ4_9GAMM|nr:type IV pilus twitching motility protein PilT [Oceanospirillum sediminis]MBB1486437.1 type IV pilus twitching motility protein PilT [Oceanospirillum sediminis]
MDITELLAFCAKQGASDLHLSAGMPPVLRMNGDMRRIKSPALTSEKIDAGLKSLMTPEQQETFQKQLELDFSWQQEGVARFRINAFHQHKGVSAVIRALPFQVPSLDQLGLGEVFRQLAMTTKGLVLVTGPTGTGKSTTLAAMLDYVNEHRSQHILTIEDPIEFLHTSKKSLVTQRELHKDTLGYSEALRAALREDPDVILVGEMRDPETIRMALTAAETGHTVFSTLHTDSAAKTVNRILDVFPAGEKALVRSMLSESLQAVVCQNLVRQQKGGRVAVHEIMRVNSAIRHLIREDRIAQMQTVMQTGAAEGMQTMEQGLQNLVSDGVISADQVDFSG